MVLCKVLVLDGTEHEFEIAKSARVQDLFDAVCLKLELVEKDYFGLTYEEKKAAKFWLNSSKKLSKYVTNGLWVFSFEVKFYPPDPFTLQHEVTRYQLFLQLRRDILSEKLPCSFVTLSLLGSYAVQSELGDYDPSKNGKGFQYLKDISFAPKQTQELLEKVAELHITHRGQSPSETENEYLSNAKNLSLYGVHMHNAKDSGNEDVQIGVCAAGLLIFKNRLRIHRFVWPKIIKISYKRNVFTIRIRPAEHERAESTLDFKLPNVKLAKRLWKLAVEHHAFFRLKASDPADRNTFARFGSNYRFSGRTQYQASQAFSNTAGGATGNMRRGGQFRSMEGLAGYTTERGEKFQDLPGQKTATLTLKGRRQGSLPLLDREDLDQCYDDGSCDGRRKAEQWQRSQNFDGFGTASSADHQSMDSYQVNVPVESQSKRMNGSFDAFGGGGGGYNSTRSRPSQPFAGEEGDELPPYQDDRLMQQKYGANTDDGKWNSLNESQVKTSTRTYVGPDGSIITEHRSEREGVIETKMKKVRREKQVPDYDYDKALSDAILAVTNMNTDLAVEKIEIQTKEEQQREYYDSEEDDDDYEGGPGETII